MKQKPWEYKIPSGCIDAPLTLVPAVVAAVGWTIDNIRIDPIQRHYLEKGWVRISSTKDRESTEGFDLSMLLRRCNEEITELMYREDYLRIFNPVCSDINHGWCHDWAHRMTQLYPIAVHAVYGDVYSNGGHSFVRIDKLFYDAECHEGVSSWKKLPVFLRFIPELQDQLFDSQLHLAANIFGSLSL